MWNYDKKLQYPVKIKNTNPRMAKLIMTQLGGPDGETGAAMRYLNQRYSCPYGQITGTLTDIGTEESGPPAWKCRERATIKRTAGRSRLIICIAAAIVLW